jgi:hypothetical protein
MASEAEGHAPGGYPVHCASTRLHTIADTCQAATCGLEPTCLWRICAYRDMWASESCVSLPIPCTLSLRNASD